MNARTVLEFVRRLKREAGRSEPSPYLDGYVDCANEVEEFIEDGLWDEGEDPSE